MNENTERLKPFLINYIQEITTKSKGKDQYICPLCSSGTGRNHTGAFTYYPDKYSYKCFACGEYGDIFSLYAKMNNLSTTSDFVQIIKDLENKYNIVSTYSTSYSTSYPTRNYSSNKSVSYPSASHSTPQPTSYPSNQATKQPVNGTWVKVRTHVYQNINRDNIATKTIYKKPDGSKTAIWHRYEGNTLVKGLNGLKMPLYHIHNLTDNTKPVFIVEGEKDVETMEKIGYIATTSPNGAGSHWRKDYIECFRGFDVIILADNDDVGLKYATEIAEKVIQIARSVKLVPSQALYVPLKPKGDISDIVECIGSIKATQLIESVLNGNEYIFTSKPSSETQQTNTNKKKPDFDDFSLFEDFMLRHGYSIRYNQITHCYEFIGFGKQESPEHLAENVPTILYDQLRKEYSKVNMMSIMNYITLYATRNRYNPVLDMIKAEKWDGKDRVTEIYNIFRIPTDDTLSCALIYKWLMQCVCGLFNNIETPFPLILCLYFKAIRA